MKRIVRIVRYRSRDSCILREKDSQDSQVQVQGLLVLHPAVERIVRIVRIVRYRYRVQGLLHPVLEKLDKGSESRFEKRAKPW